MTNEFGFGYTFVGFPNVFRILAKWTAPRLATPIKGLFKNGVAQIPSFGGLGWRIEAALVFNPGGFEAGGPSAGLYANKYMPSISDTADEGLGHAHVQSRLLLGMDPQRTARQQLHQWSIYSSFLRQLQLHLWQCVCRHAGREHVEAIRSRISIASTISRTTRMRALFRIPGKSRQIDPRTRPADDAFPRPGPTTGFGYSVFDSSQYSSELARRLPLSADSSGTDGIRSVPVADSPAELCSGSRASASPTI